MTIYLPKFQGTATWLKSMTLTALFFAAFGAIEAGLSSAAAEVTKKDILVASRALNFIQNKPSGAVIAAIVFDPANPASKASADAIGAIIGGGLKAGKVTLTAKVVPVGDLGGLSGTKIAFVAEGMGAHFSAISGAASSSGIVVASTDVACVRGGLCALGVETSPKVQIYASKSAATAAGVEFLPAFLMMVKEV